MDASSRNLQHHGVDVVKCAECGTLSGLRWAGWRAYLIDDVELEKPPALALYCHACSTREFNVRVDD